MLTFASACAGLSVRSRLHVPQPQK